MNSGSPMVEGRRADSARRRQRVIKAVNAATRLLAWEGHEEQVVAIGICTAHLEDGLLLAVNHADDSDFTGLMCGNILGAMHGADAIPAHLLAELELRNVIEEMTRDLLTEYSDAPPDTDEWRVRYPPW